MSNPFTYGTAQGGQANRYAPLGFSRNPFVPQDDDDQDGPFYSGHMQAQIGEIQLWLTESIEKQPPALSIKGTIGVGKTRLLKALRRGIQAGEEERHSYAVLVSLSKSGYTRPSAGQLLLDILDVFAPKWDTNAKSAPTGVMPIVWSILKADRAPSEETVIGKALSQARQSNGDSHVEQAMMISRWLHRIPLTPSQSAATGLYGRLDFEGQMPDVLCDLLTAAREAGVLNKLFLMIDQLEDLFRPSYSELRQSRLLTDLRNLVDRQDAGAPLAMIFSWSPDLDLLEGFYRGRVELAMQRSYAALYSRLTRRLVTLDKLRELHITAFAQTYLDALRQVPGNKPTRWPTAIDLAQRAWAKLAEQRLIQDNAATPRDLLTALAGVVEEMVKEE